MTQTIRTPAGRNAVWIESDYGQGRRGRARKVEWSKLPLSDYLERLDLQDLDADQAECIKAELALFEKGYAWEVCDTCESALFKTAEEARGWAYSRDC